MGKNTRSIYIAFLSKNTATPTYINEKWIWKDSFNKHYKLYKGKSKDYRYWWNQFLINKDNI